MLLSLGFLTDVVWKNTDGLNDINVMINADKIGAIHKCQNKYLLNDLIFVDKDTR